MTYLEFIFSSLWVFFGVLLLLVVGLDGLAKVIRAFRGRND